MCFTPDNSLVSNENGLKEMFLAGKLTKSELIGRIAASENAERIHQGLARDLKLSPDQLLLLTSYRLNLTSDPLQIK